MTERKRVQPESINWNENPPEMHTETEMDLETANRLVQSAQQRKLQQAGEEIRKVCEHYGVDLRAQVSLTADGRITAQVHLVPA